MWSWELFGDDLARLAIAAVLGGAIGLERELKGHWAGLRTHMMVAVGSAIFIVAGAVVAHDVENEITRVIQGVAAGIGFLGAGTILKLDDKRQIMGLTTAGSIWLAAALGVAAGVGEYALAAASVCVSLFVLAVLGPIETFFQRRFSEETKSDQAHVKD